MAYLDHPQPGDDGLYQVREGIPELGLYAGDLLMISSTGSAVARPVAADVAAAAIEDPRVVPARGQLPAASEPGTKATAGAPPRERWAGSLIAMSAGGEAVVKWWESLQRVRERLKNPG